MEKKKKITIYIVEDYILSRATCKCYLSKLDDMEVIGDFETAEECMESMHANPADVILMDLGLPKMNGIEATKLINTEFPKSKVIILTSHEKTEEIFACMASGAHAYALKDLPLKNLADVIHLVYEGAVWIDPRIAEAALSAFPQPKSTEFGKLYEEKKETLPLTPREIEVLKLVIKGKSNTEIAKEIFISPHTAKVHVCNILSKMTVTDRVQAAVKAVKYNIINENPYE